MRGRDKRVLAPQQSHSQTIDDTQLSADAAQHGMEAAGVGHSPPIVLRPRMSRLPLVARYAFFVPQCVQRALATGRLSMGRGQADDTGPDRRFRAPEL